MLSALHSIFKEHGQLRKKQVRMNIQNDMKVLQKVERICIDKLKEDIEMVHRHIDLKWNGVQAETFDNNSG
jgi:hypothetical protein